jgi:hypothetical protein
MAEHLHGYPPCEAMAGKPCPPSDLNYVECKPHGVLLSCAPSVVDGMPTGQYRCTHLAVAASRPKAAKKKPAAKKAKPAKKRAKPAKKAARKGARGKPKKAARKAKPSKKAKSRKAGKKKKK